MSTSLGQLRYSVSITVPTSEMDDPPVFGFTQGYTLAYIKAKLNAHLEPMGYRLARLRQELDEDVSIEIRSEELFNKIIRLAARVQPVPIIDLVAHVTHL